MSVTVIAPGMVVQVQERPPVTPVLSPDGATIAAPNGSLITAAGTWTFGTATNTNGTAILLNGASAAGGYGTNMHVLNQGKLYVRNAQSLWWLWTGAWTSVSSPLTAPPPPPPVNTNLATLAPNTARNIGPWMGNLQRTDYGCIVYDPVKKRMLLWGGGHPAGSGTDVLALPLSTLQWASLYPPTTDVSAANVDTTKGCYISTNHPIEVHTYNALVVLARKLWVMTVSGYEGLVGYDLAANDSGADPAGHNWTYSALHNLWYYGCDATPLVGTDKILVAGGETSGSGITQIWIFDPATDTAIKLPVGYGVSGSTAPCVVYFPPNGKYYFIADDKANPLTVYEFTYNAADPMASTSVPLTTTGPRPAPNSIYMSFDYDPVNHVIGGCLLGGVYTQFDPVSKVWKQSTVIVESGSVGTPDTRFHCGRMDPESGCHIALAEQNKAAWAYRPPPFSTATTGQSGSEPMSMDLDFGGGKKASFAGGADLGTFDGEFVHQRCFMATDPAFPGWRVFFRPDVDGKRDEVVVEYEGAVNAGAYTATVKRGSAVYTAKIAEHQSGARWRWQSAPRPVVRTTAVLKQRGWIENFGPQGLRGVAPWSAVDPWTGPFCVPKTMDPAMGSAGDNNQIGLLTEAAADYCITGSKASLDYVRSEGEWYANGAMHVRAADGSMLDVRGGKLRYKSDGGTVGEGSGVTNKSSIALDFAHWYPCPNLGWMLTDDPYLLEELQFGINWRLLYSQLYRSQFKLEGLGYVPSVRGTAWLLRDLFLLASSTPAKVPKWLQGPATWKGCLADHLTFANLFVKHPSKVCALFRAWPNWQGVQAWMQAWLSTVIGIGARSFPEWKPIFDWAIQLQIAQTDGLSGWPRQFAAPYTWYPIKDQKNYWIAVPDATMDAATCSTWQEAGDYHLAGADGRSGINHPALDGTTLIGNPSYVGHVRAALVVAIRQKIPGAQACYDYVHKQLNAQFMGNNGQARFSIDP